jgi:hypothetical protein
MWDGSTRDAWVLATWTALLHGTGDRALSPDVVKACDALVSANFGQPTRDAGDVLVQAVSAVIAQAGGVQEAAVALFGDRAGQTFHAPSRDERSQRIRAYDFKVALPWLARLWQRHDGGDVRPGWEVVLSVDTHAHILDPNPYDDVDENRDLPVADFHVLWELSGAAHIHLHRG